MLKVRTGRSLDSGEDSVQRGDLGARRPVDVAHRHARRACMHDQQRCFISLSWAGRGWLHLVLAMGSE